MKKQKADVRFVLCIRNDGFDDLEPRKVYQVIADPSAVEEGYIRVIDDSGEDYLYPADYCSNRVADRRGQSLCSARLTERIGDRSHPSLREACLALIAALPRP